MSLLSINNLRIEFPNRHGRFVAVESADITVSPGEIVGLIGESGAGKSTIGNAILGLLEPPGEMSGGQVALSSERIDNLPRNAMQKVRGKKIGMIFQDPLTSLDPVETVGEQLIETISLHLGLSRTRARLRAIELLRDVGIAEPEFRVDLYPHQFSGGMRQRVVIALALCAEPDLIIADEPTTALDVSVQAQILDLMKRLCKERQMGMILVTHDMGVIAETADRVYVMYHGRIVESGAATKILSAPEHPYTKSLIAAVPRADVKVHRFPLLSFSKDDTPPPKALDLTAHWLGQERDFAAHNGPLLELSDLRKEFVIKRALLKQNSKMMVAVDDVSFSIEAGKTFGLVGESGSGKSTIARLISGIYAPTAGKVSFAGTDLTQIRSRREAAPWRRQMQMIFQDPFSSLNGRIRVRDIIAEPIRFHGLADSKAECYEIVEGLLEAVGLGAAAGAKFPHEFSGGQRQRISIARALATKPRFLICDEPTSALDVSVQAQILNLLKDLQEQLNLTMLFISHDLPVIRQMCDEVGVMRRGKLIEVAPAAQLFESPGEDYTRHLLELLPQMPPPAAREAS